jgi:serine/threonine protein kinase
MMLLPGGHVGPYEILASIGAGGMGEVVRARDTRLGRVLAIAPSRREGQGRHEVRHSWHPQGSPRRDRSDRQDETEDADLLGLYRQLGMELKAKAPGKTAP